MSALRRLLNRIDRALDRRSLHAPQTRRERPPGGGVPCLASHALERAVKLAHEFDEDARLKHALAPRGVAEDGAALRWEFVFDLPQRRAKLLCQWYLDGEAKYGRFGRECFDASVLPFPPADSALARAVAEGHAAYGQCTAAWREERRRTPDLPLEMRDSDAVMAELQRQGLRPPPGDWVMRNGWQQPGGHVWLAQVGDAAYTVRFA